MPSKNVFQLGVSVRNMESRSSYRDVPNQYIITTQEGDYFQSYQTVIGFKPHNPGAYEDNYSFYCYLDERAWDYSRTTAKYRNQWLGMTAQEVKQAIEDGRIKLVNLN